MSSIGAKLPPLRLDPASYENLRQKVLRRDGWRCQSCGTMSNLEVHHKEFRSQSGDDSEENLITLCTACHHETHNIVKMTSLDNGTNQHKARQMRKEGFKKAVEKKLTGGRLKCGRFTQQILILCGQMVLH